MALGGDKASTQDATNGTPFAKIVNEDVSANDIQAVAVVGSKSTWSKTTRTSITVADSATDMSNNASTGFVGTSGSGKLASGGNAASFIVMGHCNTPNCCIRFFLAFYDASSNYLGKSRPMCFISDASKRISAAGDYICDAESIPAGIAQQAAAYVSAVSGGGTWEIDIQPG